MPINHSIDRDNHLSVTTIRDTISVSEAVDFIKARAADPERENLPVLVDAGRADEHHNLLINDMELLARLAAEIHRSVGGRREAFVVSSEQNAGLMAFFKKFSVNGPNQMIFDDRDAAIAWLKTGD